MGSLAPLRSAQSVTSTKRGGSEAPPPSRRQPKSTSSVIEILRTADLPRARGGTQQRTARMVTAAASVALVFVVVMGVAYYVQDWDEDEGVGDDTSAVRKDKDTYQVVAEPLTGNKSTSNRTDSTATASPATSHISGARNKTQEACTTAIVTSTETGNTDTSSATEDATSEGSVVNAPRRDVGRTRSTIGGSGKKTRP